MNANNGLEPFGRFFTELWHQEEFGVPEIIECPTSPNLECDYEQEDGSYNEDCCRYCGQPEERK